MTVAAKKEVKKTAPRKTTSSRKQPAKKTENDKKPKDAVVTEAAKPAVLASPAKKKRDSDELIPCISQFPGSLILVGRKTGNLYQWDEIGEVMEVFYGDLLPEILNKNSKYVYDPLFVIDDEQIISERKGLKELYDSILPPAQMRKLLLSGKPAEITDTLKKVPESVRNNIKSLASTMIQSGELDKMSTVKALDEGLNTQLSEMLNFS